MRANHLIATVACGLLLAACPKQEAAPEQAGKRVEPSAEVTKDVPIIVEGVGFQTPESVLHDAEADVYLVSNIHGQPLDPDGNGFISRLSPGGKVLELKWIDGTKDGVTLNAPKGMTIAGDLLYVADLSALRTFDRKTGEPRGAIEVEGATFLNGLTTGPDGTVYFTDTGFKPGGGGFVPAGNEAVYRLVDGKAEALLKIPNMGHPNGVVVDDQGVLVCTFGGDELFRIGDQARAEIQELPTGSLDGLIYTTSGEIYVSSWEGASVMRGKVGGVFAAVLEGVRAPAGLGYDAKRDRLLLPLFNGNAIHILPLPLPVLVK